MTKSFILISVCLLFTTLSLAQSTWELLNPTPTYESGLGIHFVTPQRGYIITNGKLLETTDMGDTWNEKLISNPNQLRIKDFAFQNSLGVIVGEHGFALISYDSGNTWNNLFIDYFEHFNSVTILDEETIIVSSLYKLYKTEDKGQNWQNLDVPLLGNLVTCSHFTSFETGHLGLTNGTLMKTDDGGASWYVTEQVSTSSSDLVEIYFINDNVGFATRKSNDFLRTTDGGETWQLVADIDRLMYAIYFVNENVGYAGGEAGAMFKTTDGGISWESTGFLNTLQFFSDVNGVCFIDQNTGFAVGQRGRIMKTTDGGVNWSPFSPTYYDLFEIEFPSNDVGYALGRNDLLKTTDGGLSWESLNFPMVESILERIEFIDENVGYAILSGNGFMTPYSNYIFKTLNGGATWNPTNSGAYLEHNVEVTHLSFINEQIGYACAGLLSGEGVFKTSDGGGSWTRVSELEFGKIQFITPSLGYAMRFGEKTLYKTEDGGANWITFFEGEKNVKDFQFLDADHGFVVGPDGMMYKTANGGEDWEELDVPYFYYVIVEFVSEDVGFIIDDDGEIFETKDGGNEWVMSGSFHKLYDICYSESNLYVAGSFGKILSTGLGPVGTVEFSGREISRIRISPNPSVGDLIIESLDQGSIAEIEVFDLTGKKINTSQTGIHSSRVEISVDQHFRGIALASIIFSNGEKKIEKLIIN